MRPRLLRLPGQLRRPNRLGPRLADWPGIAISGCQRIGAHWPELAQPLLGREIGAIVRLLAILPPPAHRYLHTASREHRSHGEMIRRAPQARPTGQRSHAREGAATRRHQLTSVADRALASEFMSRRRRAEPDQNSLPRPGFPPSPPAPAAGRGRVAFAAPRPVPRARWHFLASPMSTSVAPVAFPKQPVPLRAEALHGSTG